MAVDVGCGTGRYTAPLAPHFKSVLGIDISDSQINLAKQYNLADNVSYMVASAEKLPMKNDSVDLVNVGLAAHWFTVDKFVSEAARVLKKNGCLAVHAFYPGNEIEYEDLSHDLNAVMAEVWDTLNQHCDYKIIGHMFNQYKHIFEAVPLKDKEWITDIPVTYQMSLLDVLGFIQSIIMYQTLVEKDPIKAEEFIIKTKEKFFFRTFITLCCCRLLQILGDKADSAVLNVHVKHYCVLACKH
ncbi:methyltransferase DDB_G0268948-like [Pristimantis euphronides]